MHAFIHIIWLAASPNLCAWTTTHSIHSLFQLMMRVFIHLSNSFSIHAFSACSSSVENAMDCNIVRGTQLISIWCNSTHHSIHWCVSFKVNTCAPAPLFWSLPLACSLFLASAKCGCLTMLQHLTMMQHLLTMLQHHWQHLTSPLDVRCNTTWCTQHKKRSRCTRWKSQCNLACTPAMQSAGMHLSTANRMPLLHVAVHLISIHGWTAAWIKAFCPLTDHVFVVDPNCMLLMQSGRMHLLCNYLHCKQKMLLLCVAAHPSTIQRMNSSNDRHCLPHAMHCHAKIKRFQIPFPLWNMTLPACKLPPWKFQIPFPLWNKTLPACKFPPSACKFPPWKIPESIPTLK